MKSYYVFFVFIIIFILYGILAPKYSSYYCNKANGLLIVQIYYFGFKQNEKVIVTDDGFYRFVMNNKLEQKEGWFQYRLTFSGLLGTVYSNGRNGRFKIQNYIRHMSRCVREYKEFTGNDINDEIKKFCIIFLNALAIEDFEAMNKVINDFISYNYDIP